MQSRNKTVVGVYDTRDEALEVVGRLKDAGYQKENIILYANEDVTQTQSDYEAVNIEADTTGTPQTRETQDDDNSLWQQIKDTFSSDTYDHEESRKQDMYKEEDDLLYPYRVDIKNGKVVVVLDGYKGEDLNQYDEAGTVSNDTRESPVTEKADTHPETESDGFKKEDHVKANDPLTEGRDFSREDEDMDAYKKK